MLANLYKHFFSISVIFYVHNTELYYILHTSLSVSIMVKVPYVCHNLVSFPDPTHAHGERVKEH